MVNKNAEERVLWLKRAQDTPPYRSNFMVNGDFYTNEWCYGFIEDRVDIIHELSISIRRDKCNKGYAKFVFNLFEGAFLNSSVDEGLEQGFDLNVELPYNYLLGAMIALRKSCMEEYTKVFDEMIFVGASTTEAFILCDILQIREDHLVVWPEYRPDHLVFGTSLKIEDVEKGSLKPLHDLKQPPSNKEINIDTCKMWDLWGRSNFNTLKFTKKLVKCGQYNIYGGLEIKKDRATLKKILNELRKEY
jgi:hypothetical protein